MIGTAELLEFDERCHLAGYWAQTWQRRKFLPSEMLQRGLEAGLTEAVRSDHGQVAGEALYGLGADPGLQSDQMNLHDEVVHLSAICDIVCTAVRKPSDPPWRRPETIFGWKPTCFLSPDGSHLRRIVFVTSWSDDRHYSLCRSWQTLGPICHYQLPMQLVVVIIGQHRDGRYRSFWTRGLRHPVSKKLRFRKKNDIAKGFKDSWNEVWREDYDDISTIGWLQAMLDDDVLRDILLKIDVDIPNERNRQMILDLSARKMERIYSQEEMPEKNLSVCDWPTPCVFRGPCHSDQEPSSRWGFIGIEELSGSGA